LQTVEKWITRSDAWTPEDDERLASIVLQHIKTGSTQLRAFEEAASELGRTSAACGYRWNGVLRKSRREDIEAAKHERKAAQRSNAAAPAPAPADTVEPMTMTSADSMREVLMFLQTYDEQYQRMRKQLEWSEQERAHLVNRVHELEGRLGHTPPAKEHPITPEQLEEDSRALFAIMERARKLLNPDANARAD
jgi:prespore-specific regulator